VAHAQFVSNVVDYGMNIQAALSAPRFTVHGESVDCTIPIEGRFKPEVLEQLRQKGHNLGVLGDYSSNMGRGQAVLFNSKTRLKYGASDPRADGNAEPEPLPASALQ
jgi:gamma-glutamyltranspeptidase/glutathione hydrolase